MFVGVLIWGSLAILVLVLFIWSIFARRHRESASAETDWTATSEVFNDPSTNRLMRVWLDADGERHYVEERPENSV